jgi:hypothetical protein
MVTAQKSHDDAMDAAANYLARAMREIDNRFGDGYASKNPALVAEFIRACALEFATLQNSDR